MSDKKAFILYLIAFLCAYFLPVEQISSALFVVFEPSRLSNSIIEALALTKWYAREHVLLCLVPAFFIAGAVASFVSQASVMKYLGAGAKRVVAYSVAAVSGSILAVCSCTILPLFAGIYARGAGLGPATAFLYSGPAINVLAIILTARVLGAEMGIARAVLAIVFAVVIGLLMQFIFRKEELEKLNKVPALPIEQPKRKLWQEAAYFALMIGILVFANWGMPAQGQGGVWSAIFDSKWIISGVLLLGLGFIVFKWFDKSEHKEWVASTWEYARMILPLLFAGVMVAGFLLGSPDGGEGLIPSAWVSSLVGGNSFFSNFFASLVGSFMYFATLTEVPILEGLIKSGMGKGPALALLLAGPALSLPNMLVIRGVLGNKKTVVYVLLVVVMSTLSGIIFGAIFG